jgi:hypothetical protein
MFPLIISYYLPPWRRIVIILWIKRMRCDEIEVDLDRSCTISPVPIAKQQNHRRRGTDKETDNTDYLMTLGTVKGFI